MKKILVSIFLAGIFFGCGGDMDEKLLEASKKGDIPAAEEALEKGADLEAREQTDKMRKGFTPLMLAVKNGQMEMVKFLLGKGADVNAVNKSGRTVLMEAVLAGSPDMVKAIAEAGAELNRKNKSGEKTAMDYALEVNHSGILEYLKSKEAKKANKL
jgi:ankyrin repeat protein